MWKALPVCLVLVLLVFALAGAETRLQAAEGVAHWRWGPVCAGQVDVFNRPLKPPLIAIATWNHGFTDCEVTYTTRRRWHWWDLCRATVHEWGHLAGRGHSRNPRAVMFEWTLEPWWPCGPDHAHPRTTGPRWRASS